MKRSEVLKIIEGLFILELDLHPKINPPEIFAENLLCNLEMVGMKPPAREIIGETEFSFWANTWEKEDDL